MTFHDLLSSADTPADDRLRAEVLLRPGLRKAFPLPDDDVLGDERFHRLLEALAHRKREPGGTAERSMTV